MNYKNQAAKDLKANLKRLGGLLLLMVPIILLWDTFLLYPLKILTVFFHELSHGLASVLTGGDMVRIELSRHQGGMCTTLGGNTFIILSAGYLGSLIWGGIILVASARMKYDKEIVTILGAILLGVGAVYVRPIFSFGFPYCLVLGFALIMSGRYLSAGFNDILAKIIGLTSCLYAAIDIISDTLTRSVPCSDANALARLYFLPGWFWGLIWLVIAIVGTGFFLLIASAKDLDEVGKD